ncbi:paired domain-containing protein [Trichonephila clavipes]|nr:paired domain-containing protein [Trichonephila clavipes]
MAPKTKEISVEMRKHITELHKEGKSFREIGKILKLSFTAVGYIIKKYLESHSVENKLRPGSPSKLTSRAKRMIVKSETNKPMTSAQNIANELLCHHVSFQCLLRQRLETPSQSPDLNPIENVWMHLETEVRKKNLTILLQSVPANIKARMWFQHDGMPAYFSADVRSALDTASPGRWIGRGGPVN